LASDGISVIRTPLQAPAANAQLERWIGTARRECLRPPDRADAPAVRDDAAQAAAFVRRRDLLAGLVHEYQAAA
jgi:hypothetical protein